MSVRDELRARRERLRNRDRHLDYEVPGYEPAEGEPSDLVVRFNPMPYAVITRYQLAMAKYGFGFADISDEDAEEMLRLDCQALIDSCREILVREDGELKPYVPGQTTDFGTVDEAMGFKADTAIESVREVFADDLDVGSCAAKVRIWTERNDRFAEDELVGEHEGGQRSSGPPEEQQSD